MACCVSLYYDKPKNQKCFWNTPKLTVKKKTVDIAKEKLLSSILEIEDQDDLDIDIVVKHTNSAQEVFTLITTYESIKSKNKRIIYIAGIQGMILKRFKEEDGFWDMMGLSRSYAYFKIKPYEFLLEFTLLKNSNPAPIYFKVNFKLITKACKKYSNMFKKNWMISLQSLFTRLFWSSNALKVTCVYI